MTAPRVEIDLAKVHHNARTLVERLAPHGIAVTGVTKATLGSPAVATELLRAGVRGLGDSRVENLEALRRAGVSAPLTLIRSPMPSQIARVVAAANVSCNTELEVIRALSSAAGAQRLVHGIVLMVELGDLREGILPDDVEAVAREVGLLPNLALTGIGTNLACQSGVVPGADNMSELSGLVKAIETSLGLTLAIVSGGNSASLDWALSGAETGPVNDLRLGESILLGREPLHRRPIEGLHTDAFTVVAEVIESIRKPSEPWGQLAQTAFGARPARVGHGDIVQTIVAIGHQDTDPAGLQPPAGIEVLGASSDHLVLDAGRRLAPGTEVRFQPNYGALVRAMTSPFVTKAFAAARPRPAVTSPVGDAD
ncbi:MAG: hypothetical protein JWN46_243 [Acidimicrobiales bacterium]|nr:hypothetical protein [Acidimicrobiales bacterium]